jgi:hypothetical protein
MGEMTLDDEELSDFLFYLFILVMSQSKWLIEKKKRKKIHPSNRTNKI